MKKVKRYVIEEAKEQKYPKWVASPVKDGKLIIDQFVGFDSFDKVSYLAEGKTCRSSLARYLVNGKFYCLKGIKKKWMYQSRRFNEVKRQLELHISINHRFIVNVFRVFDHHSFIYSVQEYCLGGTLQMLLDGSGKKIAYNSPKLNLETARFYCVEIISALEFLHSSCSIIYRNLCAENVGIAWNGHVKLLGFGNAIKVDPKDPFVLTSNESTHGDLLCVPPERVPPRLIEAFLVQKDSESGEGETSQEVYHSYPSDWWTLGNLFFKMIYGFDAYGIKDIDSDSDIARNIIFDKREQRYWMKWLNKKYAKTGFLEVLEGLLQIDEEKRWTVEDIKSSKFFGIVLDWELLHRVSPPYVPKFSLVEEDTSCFKKSQLKRKKYLQVGVYPEELEARPTPEEISYCYFTHICKEIVGEALQNHTITSKIAYKEYTKGDSFLSFDDDFQNSEMLGKLQRGWMIKNAKKKNKQQQLLKQQHLPLIIN